MRTMARAILKLIIIASIIAFVSPYSFAGVRGANAEPQIGDEKSAEAVIDSYCETNGVPEIVNLDGYDFANCIQKDKRGIKIVKDKKIKPVYAKQIDPE